MRLPPLLLMFAALVALPTAAAAQREPRTSEILAAADDSWRAGRYDEAFERYQLVLRRDSTTARAVFRVATMLGWRNDLDRSVSLFRVYVRLAPGDDDGRIGLARTLAWSGHYDQSIAICDSVLGANPQHREAALLAAQAYAWSGNLRGAIARYRSWLSAHGADADGWIALAQTWQWAGRPEDARDALERAVGADPNNSGARVRLEWAKVALMPSFEPTISSTNDSDENRSTTYLIRSGWRAPWNARLVADASYRVADLANRHGTAATVRAASSWADTDGQWTLRGEIGATRLDAADAPGSPHATRVEPVVAARLTRRLTPRLSFGGGLTRAAFDETAQLILTGITTTAIEADGDFAIRPRLTLGGGGGWTRLGGGSGPNTRLAGSAALRWSLRRFISVAAGARSFSYEHAAFDGYFAPKRYLLAELSARTHLGGELGWMLESELGLGNQRITAFDNSSTDRFAQRANAMVVYRPAPGLEWGIGGGWANAASPTAVSSANYRAYNVVIKGRVRLERLTGYVTPSAESRHVGRGGRRWHRRVHGGARARRTA